jgi:hypothetical protein
VYGREQILPLQLEFNSLALTKSVEYVEEQSPMKKRYHELM